MAVQLSDEVIAIINDSETVKVLATVDQDGNPRATFKQSLAVGEDGNLFFLELLESSQSNRNLVRSIWFNRKVTVTVRGKTGQSYQIKGRPVRNIIAGPVFEQKYVEVRERLGDVDLAGIWIIEPEEISDQTYKARKATEEAAHPFFLHLDRIAK